MDKQMSQYPLAIDANMVGEYPALVKSGAGYFYDDVLEYRVWCHPERGASDECDGQDYYRTFVSFEHKYFQSKCRVLSNR